VGGSVGLGGGWERTERMDDRGTGGKHPWIGTGRFWVWIP
jgi:hypothetical protein